MDLTQALQENRSEIERINGGPLSKRDLALVKVLIAAGTLYEILGRKDAATGLPARPEEGFALGCSCIDKHMYKRYEDGYTAENAALSIRKFPQALFQTCDLSGMIRHPEVNNGQPVPVFSPKPRTDGKPSINTLDGWNAAAQEQNRLSFERAIGRPPADDAELNAWVGAGPDYDSQE